MKKIIFIMATIFSLAVNAQDFPGESIEMLDGKELKVKKANQKQIEKGYSGFFKDEKFMKPYKDKGYATPYRHLEGKVFKVVSYAPSSSDYTIKLDNPETGILYFRYHTTSAMSFPFEVVGGLVFPEGHFCKDIGMKEVWNRGEVKYNTYIFTPDYDDIAVVQEKAGEPFKMIIKMKDISSTKETIKGLTLYLDDRELNFPEVKIDVMSIINDNYRFTAEFELKKEEIAILKEHKILRKKIGTHEKDVEYGDLIREYIKCITEGYPK